MFCERGQCRRGLERYTLYIKLAPEIVLGGSHLDQEACLRRASQSTTRFELHTPSIRLEVQSLDRVMLDFIQIEGCFELVILGR